MSASPAPINDQRAASQRIDQWLWHARQFKTRTLAAKMVSGGQIRLTRNGATWRIDKPSASIQAGDTLVFMRGEALRILKIESLGARRGPASEAQSLYTDQSPPPEPKKSAQSRQPFEREPGAGRPTKRDRRKLDSLRP